MPDMERDVVDMLAAGRADEAPSTWSSPRWTTARRRLVNLILVAVAVGVVAGVIISLLPANTETYDIGPPPIVGSGLPEVTPPPQLEFDGGSPTALGPYSEGRHSLTVDNVQFSFRVPDGWERFGSLYISKSTVGPREAEAIIYWSRVGPGDFLFDGKGADACGQWWGAPSNVHSASALAAAASSGLGASQQLLTRPSFTTVGRHAAQQVAFTSGKVQCQPGYYYTWHDPKLGAFWPGVMPGDTIRIWIVDVGRGFMYIEGDTAKDAGQGLANEVVRVVQSIHFR